MKTKRSTLIGLLSTLLVIVTVLSSVLVFTATADSTEPEASPDIYTYASSVDELKEKTPLTDWYLDEDGWDVWYEVDPATNGRDTGYYFIDLTELDYDTVAFAIGSQNKNILRYAFLTEMPENDGDLPKFAEGTEYNKMETSDSSTWKKKLAGKLFFDDIPEDAKYLAVLGRYWGSSGYCPTSITFLRADQNLLRNDLATYAYPMQNALTASHTVSGSQWALMDSGKTADALIPIAGTTFDSVTFTPSVVGDTVEYNFLTGIPGNWGSIPSVTVDGSSGMKTAAAGESVTIPAGAEYIVIRSRNKDNLPTAPAAVTFVNSNAVVTEDWLGITGAKTVTHTSFTANGCVYGWDGYDYSHKWVEAADGQNQSTFVDLTDHDYKKVTFVVGDGGYLGYAFLAETPVLDKKVTYATCNGSIVSPSNDTAGTTIEVNIPANATTLVLWMYDSGDATSYAPASATLTYEETAAAPYGIELGAVAEARLNANSGLRFTTRIPTAELAGLDYTVGTLIFPTDALVGDLTVDTEGVLDIEMTRGVVGGDYTYFSAAMTSIIAQNYAREFTAVSYIKVDGEYYYTDATSSSIYEAAVETYKANAEDANADAVRAYIDGVVVIEDGEQVMPYVGYEHALTATITGNTLTITGDAALATVIIDGEIYTGGWTTTADGYTATID